MIGHATAGFRQWAGQDSGLTTHYEYDDAGRKIAENTGGRITKYFYDSLGNLEIGWWLDGLEYSTIIDNQDVKAAIAAIAGSADNDQVGLAFYTHPTTGSTDGAGNIRLCRRISGIKV